MSSISRGSNVSPLELAFVLLSEHVFEDVIEAAVVSVENGVFGGEEWEVAFQGVLKATASKLLNVLGSIVHRHHHSGDFESEDFQLLRLL